MYGVSTSVCVLSIRSMRAIARVSARVAARVVADTARDNVHQGLMYIIIADLSCRGVDARHSWRMLVSFTIFCSCPIAYHVDKERSAARRLATRAAHAGRRGWCGAPRRSATSTLSPRRRGRVGEPTHRPSLISDRAAFSSLRGFEGFRIITLLRKMIPMT
jgi:hypothetical protein